MEDVNETLGKLYKTEALAFFPEDPPKSSWEEELMPTEYPNEVIGLLCASVEKPRVP